MKNIKIFSIIFLYFLCSIFCFADIWEGIHGQDKETEGWKEIKVQGTEEEIPKARWGHSMVTYNDQHYIVCGSSTMDGAPLSDIWQMDSSQTFKKIYESNSGFYGTYGHATLVLNNKLYVFFGHMDPIGAFIYSYDFTATINQGWKNEYDPNIPQDYFEPRVYFSVATMEDNIYVFGGKSTIENGLITDTNKIFGYFSYSSIDKKWIYHKIILDQNESQPKACYGHSMIAINNILYLFGGWNGQTDLNTIWEYDRNQARNNWQKIDTGQSESEIPKARSFHTMHANGSKEFWILGGLNGSNYLKDIWKFDIAKNKWIKKWNRPSDLLLMLGVHCKREKI